MSEKQKRFGVLLVSGLRTHQENYAEAFAADPRCQLIAVTDELDIPNDRKELNEQFARQLGIPYIPDLDDALKREDVTIVCICAEPERRGRVTVRCARAGKHVYIDKPMTSSIADANAVVSAVRESGVRSQMFSFIHSNWAQRAKKIAESGEIGDVVAIHADVLFAKGLSGTAPLTTPRQETYPPERFTFVDSKREMYATGVYAVGLVRWLTKRDVKTVLGITANYFFKEHLKNNVEDFGLLALTLDGGIVATIAGGRIGFMSHPQGGPNRIQLIGTKGSIVVDAYRPRVEVYADEAPWTPPSVIPNDPMAFWQSTQNAAGLRPKRSWVVVSGAEPEKSDQSHFIDCIESERESEMPATAGAAIIEVLIAGYLSAAENRVVSLPLK